MKYQVIYADPPWSYQNKASNGTADNHYDTLDLPGLKAMPVADIAEDDAVLFMWWTPPMAPEALELVAAWGFTLKNMCAFTWCKLNRKTPDHLIKKAAHHGKDILKMKSEGIELPSGYFDVVGAGYLETVQHNVFMGLGNYTRSNAESCLVAVRGKGVARESKSVKQMVLTPISAHSSKPAEVRQGIDQLYPGTRRLEMFARTAPDGWHTFGNEPGVRYDLRYSDGQFHAPTFKRARRK